ncbi:hypothetical protein FHW17_001836 [Phyllobacterium sp. P30BS-XVII]|nr:hypothetical protein [Phyllobacterium sp. P30BS-XVII]
MQLIICRGGVDRLLIRTMGLGSWFDKLTMRESEDARESSSATLVINVTAPLSLMVSLSNHGPRTTLMQHGP